MDHVSGTPFKTVALAMPFIAVTEPICAEGKCLLVYGLSKNSMVVTLAILRILVGIRHLCPKVIWT
jgi:hypothetical protein